MKNLTILLLLVAALSVSATDITVNGSGLDGTYTTISAAVQAANPGDRILVSNQSFPYQEDTLFIDKSVTILPYNDITYIDFEGQIMLTLDSIAELTLIGFDCSGTVIYSVFNDTTRSSLTTVNITDCYFNEINLDQPKTSLYLSYSKVNKVRFSHGDIIGNYISNTISLGIHDFSNETYGSQYDYTLNDYKNNFENNYYNNNLGSGNNCFSVCDLFDDNVRFGNVNTYSDTCNIIANDFGYSGNLILNTLDFAFNVRNNKHNNVANMMVYLACPTSIGVNEIINNDLGGPYGINCNLAYCSSASPSFNFRDVVLNVYNNSSSAGTTIYLDLPYGVSNNSQGSYTLSNLAVSSKGTVAYNQHQVSAELNSLHTTMFNIGPSNSGNNNPNPSAEFLNLDLTPNIIGKDGGSYAWDNYHPNGSAGFGTMTGSKARITYLNLPTQIFDPSNIKIKAKAVHGN